jgi:hypothetical protein
MLNILPHHLVVERSVRDAKTAPILQCRTAIFLTLLSASLANLGRETGLDCCDGSSRAAGVASDEVQSVLSLVEFGVWRSAGFAGDIFH